MSIKQQVVAAASQAFKALSSFTEELALIHNESQAYDSATKSNALLTSAEHVKGIFLNASIQESGGNLEGVAQLGDLKILIEAKEITHSVIDTNLTIHRRKNNKEYSVVSVKLDPAEAVHVLYVRAAL